MGSCSTAVTQVFLLLAVTCHSLGQARTRTLLQEPPTSVEEDRFRGAGEDSQKETEIGRWKRESNQQQDTQTFEEKRKQLLDNAVSFRCIQLCDTLIYDVYKLLGAMFVPVSSLLMHTEGKI